jgi:hypothetical protein
MRFSQRIGTKPVKVEIQRESMDDELRIALWNVLKLFYFDEVKSNIISDTRFESFFKALWISFFKLSLDTLDDYYPNTYDMIHDWYFSWDWDEVYDFIEFVPSLEAPVSENGFRDICNTMMERELSAYRFVDKVIVEITDDNEIREIEEAIENACRTKLTGVNAHLRSALAMLSDRQQPDYRNSIKESISAVESIAQVISGDSKAELGKALKLIEDKVGLHPALKRGFLSIYGYTSDEGGIRHAMLEESNIGFEDAKYMLVSCSSFINYLIIKATKARVNI